MIDLATLTTTATGLAINIATALAIIIVALWFSGLLKRRIIRLGERHEELDATLFSFVGSLVRWVILGLAVIFVLGTFGIQTTSLAALVGAAGLAIGLALQGTLSHFAAGVMLIAFRPIKIGDFIEAGGHAGTVKMITIYSTELATLDNVQIIIPNANIWSSSIMNYSVYKTRRADMLFGVSYSSDLKKAEEIIRAIIDADDRTHKDPEPFVMVTNLGDSSVDFTVRVWCDASDLFTFKADITRRVKEAFDEGGIDIPYPTSVVHRIND